MKNFERSSRCQMTVRRNKKRTSARLCKIFTSALSRVDSMFECDDNDEREQPTDRRSPRY
jgi:hypothetical protein